MQTNSIGATELVEVRRDPDRAFVPNNRAGRRAEAKQQRAIERRLSRLRTRMMAAEGEGG